jgi:hypothetical protein
MWALRAHHRGGPETLVFEAAPRPRPGDGEVLVAVAAAGITFAELTWDLSWTTRRGRLLIRGITSTTTPARRAHRRAAHISTARAQVPTPLVSKNRDRWVRRKTSPRAVPHRRPVRRAHRKLPSQISQWPACVDVRTLTTSRRTRRSSASFVSIRSRTCSNRHRSLAHVASAVSRRPRASTTSSRVNPSAWSDLVSRIRSTVASV